MSRDDQTEDSTLYTCNSIEDATNLLDSALIIGESPALIVFDHAETPKAENLKFSRRLHDSIPESWIVELVPDSMPLPDDDCEQNGFYWIRRPVNEEEWYKTLEQVLVRNGSPQWASNS